ncbi:MAG: hypothetical protein PGMFKBFP_01613 [Anaerolineales bacterium]|nr:hypothetical protein [Anaerolineales bacterium]
MVKTEVIRKRLQKLDEYLKILRAMRSYSLEEFLGDPKLYGSAERFLHLAIEVTLDIGNHIVADLGLGEVNWYSDIVYALEEKKFISEDLREKWIRMVGFRNVLVHDYLEVDRKIVFDVLRNHLQDLNELRKVFSEFL